MWRWRVKKTNTKSCAIAVSEFTVMGGLLPPCVFHTSVQPAIRIYTIKSGTQHSTDRWSFFGIYCDESVSIYSKTIGALFFLITVAVNVPLALVT
jgi:hypothetical protein